MPEVANRCGFTLGRTVSFVLLQAAFATFATVAAADNDSAPCAALREQARVLAAQGKTEESVARYRECLVLAPDDDDVLLAMAMTLSWSKERRHLEQAEDLLTKYSERNPADDAGLLQRARVRSWMGSLALAVSDFRAYLAKHPGDEPAALELAMALSSSRDRESQAEAIAIYDAHVTRHPGDLAIVLRRARVRAWTGETAGALSDYRRYLAVNPDAADVELELARTSSWSKNVDDRREASRLLERHRARHRDDESLALEHARTLSSIPDQASMSQALRIYDEYLGRHPGAFEVLRLRGRVRAWAGMSGDAARDLAAYADANPGDDGAALELADVVAQSRDPAAAIPLYDAYLARRPDDDAARARRARARMWAGDHATAEHELDLLRAHARSDEQKNELDLQLARLYAQTERRETALDLVDGALVRVPKDQAAQAERTRLQTLLGPRLEPRFFYYSDKARLLVAAMTVDGRLPVTRRLSLLADVGVWSLGVPAETLRAGRANAGALLRIGAVELEAAGGPRAYERFDPAVGARAAARVQTRQVKAGVDYQFDDLYIDTFQPASIAAGIRGHAAHLTGDAILPLRIRATGRVGSRLLISDNQSFDATGRIFVRVIGPVSVGYDVQYLTWRFNDPSYWSPQAFAAHLGAVKAAQTLFQGKLAYEAQALAGIAGERIAHVPEAGFGFSYGGSAALSYSPAPRLVLRIAGQYSSTIREVPRPIVSGVISSAPGANTTATTPSTYWWATTSASVTVFL